MNSESERFWPPFAVRVFETTEEMMRSAVEVFLEVVDSRTCRLALPTGRTFVSFYGDLAERCRQDPDLDLSAATGFNLDELVLPAAHPKSFSAYMEKHVWSQTTLDRTRFAIPQVGLVTGVSSGKQTDDSRKQREASMEQRDGALAGICRAYDRTMAEFEPLDLALLGVGVDGHVGYNLPGPAHGGSHAVQLPEALAEELEVPEELRPLMAVTMGFAPLHSARRVLLLASGESKAEAVRRLVQGPSDPQWPCTLLREHRGFEVYLDRKALGGLDFQANRGFARQVE